MSSKPPSAPPGTNLPRRWFWLIGALGVAPWLLLTAVLAGWLPLTPRVPRPPVSAPTAQAAAGNNTIACRPGPWGDLHYTPIYIEPPDDHIKANFPRIDHVTWTFKGYDAARLQELWRRADLTTAEKQTLGDAEHQKIAGNTILVRADRDFVLGLSPQARTIIYTALSEFPENPAQSEPFRFSADRSAQWFQNSGLQPATLAKVQRLIYRRGNSLLFSDQALLLPDIPTLEERTLLLKTLARKSTMIVTLHVTPQTDVNALDDYWSQGNRSKDIKPLLQSLAQQPGGMDIDISHVLPRLPRSLIYTYPLFNDVASHTYLDCHWTSLNFFNAIPDARYQDINNVIAAYQHDYHPVTSPPQLGDIYLFVKPNGDIIHSCVYIADDIVFTKNGANPSAPWIFMTLPDVIAFYPTEQALDIQRYRANDLSDDN